MRFGDHNYKQLTIPAMAGVLPRRTRYGHDDAWELGLTPIEYQDQVELLEWGDLKEALEAAHTERSMPLYHQQATWAEPGFRYNQNGIGYCWTWSGTAALMDCRAAEARETVPLAPVSMGYLVGWKDRGNYLESFIEGARKTGVAPVEFVDGKINSHNRNPKSYRDGWEQERLKYRLDETWDTDARSGDRTMILHCATILTQTARPLYATWGWWGHAVECVGMAWDESQQNNIKWLLRNSHNENDFIELTGSRGVPDEAYGFVSTVLAD